LIGGSAVAVLIHNGSDDHGSSAPDPVAEPTNAITSPPRAPVGRHLVLKDGAPDVVRNWFDNLPAIRAEQAKDLEAQVEWLTARRESESRRPIRRRVMGHNAFGGEETQPDEQDLEASHRAVVGLNAQIASCERTITQLKTDPCVIAMPKLQHLRVGLAGRVDDFLVKIFQVVDHENGLVNMYAPSGSNMWEYTPRLVWVSGVDASKYTDDQEGTIKLTGTFFASGTKQYVTPIGATRTVLLLERLDVEPYVSVEGN
jgi:hypothetical protein